jgi:predicted nucleotide-binding protein
MIAPHDELLAIAERESALSERSADPRIGDPVSAIERAAEAVGKAWGGSWLGYQAFVYYKGLQPPPAGVHFSSEWGFQEMGWVEGATTGDWQEYRSSEIEDSIYRLAGNPDLTKAREFARGVEKTFDSDKADVASLLGTELAALPDPYLEGLKKQLDGLRFFSLNEFIQAVQPKGSSISRDTLAVNQGTRTPPHIAVLAEIRALSQFRVLCDQLSGIARKAGSHISRRSQRQRRTEVIGTNVFIGHGRSLIWKDLKDFVQGRLGLPWDEFNRVPVAGVTNIARLSEMLDAAAVAFLVLTGEDEQKDETLQPRMNVVHEAGLFQGRLGFTKAIILLEEGCDEFTNIQGLGQIRFPKGNIKASFEDIRLVLEREGVLGVTPQAPHL